MSRKAISVSTLVRYIKTRLESDAMMQKVIVEGEISNFSNYRSGHWYFSLKDSTSQMRCVMFSSYNQRINFTPKDGDKVLIQADLSVFEARGEMQLMVTAMKQAGIGDLYTQFELLKQKLAREGLFDIAHKKAIPKYPFDIALVTGNNTAARADVLTTLSRRWPVAKITEYPVLVQGNESATQMIQALMKADTMHHDVILLVRGGGSIEDLWSFNDETLARTIYTLNTPIITGVGHEVDFTIVDFVSDLRAPTPTGAAEVCSPNIEDLKQKILLFENRMIQSIRQSIEKNKLQLQRIKQRNVFQSPAKLYMEKSLRLDSTTQQLKQCILNQLHSMKQQNTYCETRLVGITSKSLAEKRLDLQKKSLLLKPLIEIKKKNSKELLLSKISLLDAYSPLKILQRGYSITSNSDGLIYNIDQVKLNDEIQVQLIDGTLSTVVKNIQKGDKKWQKKY